MCCVRHGIIFRKSIYRNSCETSLRIVVTFFYFRVVLFYKMIYNIDIVTGGVNVTKDVRTVNTWGSSLGIRLPSKMCDWLHLRNGDHVKIELDEATSRIIITKK